MKKQMITASCLVLLSFTSACVNSGPNRTKPTIQPQQQSATANIDGKWHHTKGIFVANFAGGKFKSIATDTGKAVAIGQYNQLDRHNLRLEWYGGASQSLRKANCQLVTGDYMRCVQTNGSSFEMQRNAIG